MRRLAPYITVGLIFGLLGFTLVQVYENRSRIAAFEQANTIARDKAVAKMAAANADTLKQIRKVQKHQASDIKKIIGSLRVILKHLGGRGSDIPPDERSAQVSSPTVTKPTSNKSDKSKSISRPGKSKPSGKAKGHKRKETKH